ncbi:MAG TPA: sigma-70 family RNA polymerase sigma factor [Candidatus Polarisedimenticolia bacterium]|nr:sigma-70 family RNA polymerase sigma factor [Candidatus Polarisedimenticolia bacterium]
MASMTLHEPDEGLVLSNLPFVASIATRYRDHGLPLEDLISEGRVGLLEAARRFDPARGVRFTTYSVYWIKRAILRALASQRTLVHLPGDRQRLLRRLRETERRATLELRRVPGSDEIAGRLGLSVAEVEHLRRAGRVAASLAAPAGDRDDVTMQDLLAADARSLPDLQMEHAQALARVRCAIRRLGDRDRMILRSRFGFDGDSPPPLRVIGERLGVTREGARLAERRALRRLRSGVLDCRRRHRAGHAQGASPGGAGHARGSGDRAAQSAEVFL